MDEQEDTMIVNMSEDSFKVIINVETLREVKYFVGKGADKELILMQAVKNGSLDVMQYCIEEGTDIISLFPMLIFMSIRRHKIEILKELHKHDIYETMLDSRLIKECIEYGFVEGVKYLIEKGAEVPKLTGRYINRFLRIDSDNFFKYVEIFACLLNKGLSITKIRKKEKLNYFSGLVSVESQANHLQFLRNRGFEINEDGFFYQSYRNLHNVKEPCMVCYETNEDNQRLSCHSAHVLCKNCLFHISSCPLDFKKI